MTATTQRESAKILAFPQNIRKNSASLRGIGATVATLDSKRLPTVEFGSGWYHEAAIREAESERRR